MCNNLFYFLTQRVCDLEFSDWTSRGNCLRGLCDSIGNCECHHRCKKDVKIAKFYSAEYKNQLNHN